MPAIGFSEEHLSPATRAPQGVAVLVVGVLADHGWRVVLLDKTTDSGSAAYPRDDAHGFSVTDGTAADHDSGQHVSAGEPTPSQDSGTCLPSVVTATYELLCGLRQREWP